MLHPAVYHIQNPTLCWQYLTSQTYGEGLHFRCRQPSRRHRISYSMGKTLQLAFKHRKDYWFFRLLHPPPIELISMSPLSDLLWCFYFQWPLLGSPHWHRMLQSQTAGWTAALALSCWKSILQSSTLQVISFTYSWLLLFPLGPQLLYSCQQAGISSKTCS